LQLAWEATRSVRSANENPLGPDVFAWASCFGHFCCASFVASCFDPQLCTKEVF
jgi:hypothetical protein